MESLAGILDFQFLGNSVGRYLTSISIMLLTALALFGVRALGRRIMMRQWMFSTTAVWEMGDELFTQLPSWFLIGLAVYNGLDYLYFTTQANRVIQFTFLVLIMFEVLLLAGRLLARLLPRYILKRAFPDSTRRSAIANLVILIKIVLWICGTLFLLDNWGFEVKAILTGLGIGGVAVALAAQSVLSDVFSSFTLFLDRPFEVGDFIIFGEVIGSVEKIGLKTTEVRSLSGELMIIPNSHLTSSRIKNYHQMRERRISFRVRVPYTTPPDRRSVIPAILTAIVEQTKQTHFDRAHLAELGPLALEYEVVYFVLSPDYNLYMDIQQDINNRILEQFDVNGIEMALPVQVVQFNEDPAMGRKLRLPFGPGKVSPPEG